VTPLTTTAPRISDFIIELLQEPACVSNNEKVKGGAALPSKEEHNRSLAKCAHDWSSASGRIYASFPWHAILMAQTPLKCMPFNSSILIIIEISGFLLDKGIIGCPKFTFVGKEILIVMIVNY